MVALLERVRNGRQIALVVKLHVAAGVLAGGTAIGAPTYLFLRDSKPFGDEGDNPVPLLSKDTTGLVLGASF